MGQENKCFVGEQPRTPPIVKSRTSSLKEYELSLILPYRSGQADSQKLSYIFPISSMGVQTCIKDDCRQGWCGLISPNRSLFTIMPKF